MKHTNRNCLKCNTLVCKNIQTGYKYTEEELNKIEAKNKKPLVFNKIPIRL